MGCVSSKLQMPLLSMRSTSLPPTSFLPHRGTGSFKTGKPSTITQPSRAQWSGPVPGRPSPIPGRVHILAKAATCIEHLLYAWPQVRPPETTISDAFLMGAHGGNQQGKAGRRVAAQPHVLCISQSPVGQPESRTPSREQDPRRGIQPLLHQPIPSSFKSAQLSQSPPSDHPCLGCCPKTLAGGTCGHWGGLGISLAWAAGSLLPLQESGPGPPLNCGLGQGLC